MLRPKRELYDLLEPKKGEDLISVGDSKLRAIKRSTYRAKSQEERMAEKEEKGAEKWGCVWRNEWLILLVAAYRQI